MYSKDRPTYGSFILALLLTLFTCSACQENTYTGNSDILHQLHQGEDIADGSVPVYIDLHHLPNDMKEENSNPSTSLEGHINWRDRYIYIYAFQRDLQHVFNTYAADDKKICLIDASSDGRPSSLGKKAEIQSNGKNITWIDEPGVEYYPENHIPYEFYGYHLGGAEVIANSEKRTPDEIRLKVRYDGSNDLLVAKSKFDTDRLANYSKSDQEIIKSYYYGGLTSTMNYFPSLSFYHVMSKFTFHIQAMNAKAESVCFDDIACAVPGELTFTVVNSEVSDMGVALDTLAAADSLHLREGLKKDFAPLEPGVHLAGQGGYTQVGGEFYLPPGQLAYDIRFSMSQTTGGKTETFDDKMRLTNGGLPFEPNKHYAVKIKVYGLQEIVPEVSVTPWESGGAGDVETDTPPGGR